MVAPDLFGYFLICVDRSGLEKEPLYGFLKFSLTPSIFDNRLKVFKPFPGISEMDLQMLLRFLEIFYFLRREPLARCKFFLEKNLQFINIIGTSLQIWRIFPHLSACL
jgi:hypothetical protein